MCYVLAVLKMSTTIREQKDVLKMKAWSEKVKAITPPSS
jgi:hypothetical protein